jgi:GNAT superfamily N-acetyltransferase
VVVLEQRALHLVDGNAMARTPAPGEAAGVTWTIEPFEWAGDLRPHDLAAVTRIHNEVWAEWVAGERPWSEAAYVDADRFTAHPERMVRRLVRDARGEVVAHGVVYWREGPGGCTIRAFVDPVRRREGAGRALADALVEQARRAGRESVTVEVAEGSPAATIAAAGGFQPDMWVELNRTDPRRVPTELLAGWRAAGEAARGYSLVAYDAPCPSEDLARDFIHARSIMNDAPRFEGEAEATYTVAELLAVDAASVAAQLDWWNVGVRHDESGELVGLSEVYLPRARPWVVFQGDTGVHPDHRGHGLGAWMKAVNHLRLNHERPEVEVVQTWNAASNEPMLRINRALGFEPVQRFQGWYHPLTPLP